MKRMFCLWFVWLKYCKCVAYCGCCTRRQAFSFEWRWWKNNRFVRSKCLLCRVSNACMWSARTIGKFYLSFNICIPYARDMCMPPLSNHNNSWDFSIFCCCLKLFLFWFTFQKRIRQRKSQYSIYSLQGYLYLTFLLSIHVSWLTFAGRHTPSKRLTESHGRYSIDEHFFCVFL